MVERLHVSPNRVRGGGYLLPPLGTTEFMKKGCLLSVRYMPVLEETRSVFIMNSADDTNLVISTSNTGYDYQMLTLPDGTVWYPYFENVHFEVDAVLTDADDIPVSGKNVYMIGSQATVDYQVTDSNGECSFYFNMGNTVYTVQAQFQPDSPDSGYVDAISNILNVQCGGCSIGLSAKQGTSTITTVGYKEAFSLEATVHDTIRDVDMNGVIVSFYNGSTLLGTATSNSNGVATLNNVKIITNEGITAKIGDETSEPVTLTVTRPIVTVTPDRTHSALYGRINMTIKVVDGNGHNVSDEDVWWFATGGSYHKLSSKTNSNGELNTGVIYTTPGNYTVYAGVDAEGLNVQSERVIVTYHDTLPDSLSLSVSPSVIELEESASLTGLLTGTEAGAEIPLPGFNVSFYETYTPALGISSDKQVIESGDAVNVKVQMKDTDGSLVRQDGLTVKLYQSNAYALSVSADKPVLSYYDEDSAVLTATLEGPNVSGRSVVFKQGDTVLDTVVTDSNGEAEYTYASQGVGDVTITAECMNLQETYVLEDCIIYDSLTSNSGKWTIPSGVTSVYDNTGWKITASSYNQIKLTEKLTTACSVEFTVVDYSTPTSSYTPVIVYAYTNGETTPNQMIMMNYPSRIDVLGTSINHELVKGAVYRIDYTSSNISVYENGTLLATANNNVGLPTRFEFHIGANSRYAVYKDLKVKQL